MDRETALDYLEEAAKRVGRIRVELDWTDAEERDLIEVEQNLERFVSDAAEDYEDEL